MRPSGNKGFHFLQNYLQEAENILMEFQKSASKY